MPSPSEPHEPPEDSDREAAAGPADGSADHDALWRSIVENYGDRVELDDPEPVVPPSPRGLQRPVVDEDDDRYEDRDEDHFVPPPAPPLPRPTPARLLAWLGLFGVPVLVLVCMVTGVTLPSWLGLILMGWFVGGFVFLVASMRPDERDGYDDGAVL